MKIFTVFAAAFLLLPTLAKANSAPSFNNVTAADYDKIVRELSANFSYSSVTPASSLGGLWGFEFGVTAGITKTPEILDLVKRAGNTSFKENRFPHAAALARIGLPLGLTAEAMIFPKVTVSDLSLSQYGGAAMWTISDSIWEDLPFDLAVKAFFTKTSLDFEQTINNSSTANIAVRGTIGYDNTMWGAQALVSKQIYFLEPYAMIGFSRAKGELAVQASGNPNATIFTSDFVVGSRAVSKPSSIMLAGGLDIRLLAFTIGAEYLRSFKANSFTGRVGFRF
jgi:hypothetical protein